MEDAFLPIGTIIRIHNGNKTFMICGRLIEREEDGQLFEYCAVTYPEGVIDPSQFFLFNTEDIAEIIFTGYKNQEDEELQEFLKRQMN